ncbi:hypothetical protein [Bacillus dakarensis]|uniref:hypothetical protein n=1 Tax=Robertmurraya dakarensis TaxID=1926278 RepID=UPI000982379A|nr:hypothetical protein [Bacillus dakarensis]
MRGSIKLLIFGGLGVFLIFKVTGIVSFYSAPVKPLSIEMVAYNSLTDAERELIKVSPKDSIVKKVPVKDDIKSSIDKIYNKDEVYSVTFNNTNSDSSGNLVVYVGLDKKSVLGKGFTNNSIH